MKQSVVWRIWFVSSQLQHVLLSLGGYGPSESCILGQQKIPSEGSFSLLGFLPQTAVNFGLQKGSQGYFCLVFSRESKLIGFIAQRQQGNPKSRLENLFLVNVRLSCGQECGLFGKALRKCSPLISKRLLDIFCGIENYIVTFIEHLQITLVWLELMVVTLETV